MQDVFYHREDELEDKDVDEQVEVMDTDKPVCVVCTSLL